MIQNLLEKSNKLQILSINSGNPFIALLQTAYISFTFFTHALHVTYWYKHGFEEIHELCPMIAAVKLEALSNVTL